MRERPNEDFVVTAVSRAGTPTTRARGLLGSPPPAPGHGLVIERARQVHTFGMSYPIDVLFCDGAWRVLHVVRSMKPFRITKWVRGGRYVIEMRSGDVPPSVGPGTRVRVTDG